MEAANTFQTNWQSSSFNDASWTNALVLGQLWNLVPGERRDGTDRPANFSSAVYGQSGLQRALIYICGLGQYELSADGVKVGNALLTPGWSLYTQTCLYDTLDLTSYFDQWQQCGRVVLGNGMYNVPATANLHQIPARSFRPK